MSDQLTLKLESREVVRKGLSKLRAEGMVPAIIHDHGKDSVAVMAPYMVMLKTYRQAGKHHPLSLKVGTKNYMAMIKDVDFEPRKHQLRHVVFNAIKQNEAVETEVPLQLEGEIPAEKVGLVVLPQLDHVLISALPKDLPDHLTVDASGLAELGDKITIADIPVPPGVTILTEADHPIAEVEEPRVQEVEPEAEEAAEGEEGGAGEAAAGSDEASADSEESSKEG